MTSFSDYIKNSDKRGKILRDQNISCINVDFRKFSDDLVLLNCQQCVKYDDI